MLKDKKRLLKSALIFALILGQTNSGTIVGAGSMLPTNESRAISQKSKRTEKINQGKEKKTSEKAENDNIVDPEDDQKNTTISSRDSVLTSYQRGELKKAATGYVPKYIKHFMDMTNHSIYYRVNDQMYFDRSFLDLFSFNNDNYDVQDYKPDVPKDGALILGDCIYFYPYGTSNSGTVILDKAYSVDSKSGNWRMTMIRPDDNSGRYSIKFTRLKIAPNQPEIFSMDIGYYPTILAEKLILEYDTIDFSVDFPDAETCIGNLRALKKKVANMRLNKVMRYLKL